jgi:hypothetical protein
LDPHCGIFWFSHVTAHPVFQEISEFLSLCIFGDDPSSPQSAACFLRASQDALAVSRVPLAQQKPKPSSKNRATLWLCHRPMGERERVSLSLRVSTEVRDALEKAAIQSGRSLSQEAEFRLQTSWEQEFLLKSLKTWLRKELKK